MTEPWPGCHGVRLAPPEQAAGYGTSTGRPLASAELSTGPLPEPGAEELWRIEAEIPVPGGTRAVDQRLWTRDDGAYVLRTGDGAGLVVDTSRPSIAVTAASEAVARQLVTTIALPLVLHSVGALVVHAAAAYDGKGAVLVCGASGTGKSSVLVGLVAAGWQAVSEDLCTVDLDGPAPSVRPGPPWVRRRHDDPGPAAAGERFRTPDKTAWDIGPVLVPGPVPVTLVVFLEPPGGERAEFERVDTPAAVAALAPHALWLGDPVERAARTFGPCVALAGAVPTARLRLPVGATWLDRAVSAIGAGAT